MQLNESGDAAFSWYPSLVVGADVCVVSISTGWTRAGDMVACPDAGENLLASLVIP